MAKDCIVCGKEIGGDDPRKMYCSNACKQEAHRARHGLSRPVFLEKRPPRVQTPAPIPAPSIRAVPVLHQVENDKRFLEVNHAIVEITSQLTKLEVRKQRVIEEIAKHQRRTGLTDTVQIINTAKDVNQTLNSQGSKPLREFVMALGIIGSIYQAKNTDYKKVNRRIQYKASELKEELKQIDEKINHLKTAKVQFDKALTELRKEIRQDLALPVQPEVKVDSGNSNVNLTKAKPNTLPIQPKVKEERVLSLQEFKNQQFETYAFSDGFENIIGNPEKDFSMLVYGASGNGKSTWVINFANYLAEKHGRVLYNSSEEKIGYSLKRKLMEYDSSNFSISECQTFKGLKQSIRGNGYKFVVIDSINNMRIEPKQLQELREANPDKAFIFIMQSTKGGSYKGSTEYAHDADIIVKLENYQAIVEKTRYK